jgi:serine phosphatase RsbU (regulator of sigma subunit)
MHTAFSTRVPTHAMFPLAARDMVSLYWDGATEARNVAGAFFGVDCLMEIVNAQNRSQAYQRGA